MQAQDLFQLLFTMRDFFHNLRIFANLHQIHPCFAQTLGVFDIFCVWIIRRHGNASHQPKSTQPFFHGTPLLKKHAISRGDTLYPH
ncbi:hypothetical protein EBQ25_02180 [Allofranklinella schreckenbergeri]|uniref:Uncharacterized protein n=1 Tax=Allofranklinella schreckenbergeri TaxID=1076744 RepID=A0A3M6QG42_9BURK|nr:hypothetical protein EBQ25_02180 [Allofranklinella schreckenbergeri]